MLLQNTLAISLTLALSLAKPQPDKEATNLAKENIKYNYGYKILNDNGSQEKQEQRDGLYALGRYYVHGADSSQTVEYLADDWGFHPLIQYSNVGPHSKSSTQIALGAEAVKALHGSQKHDGTAISDVSEGLKKLQELVNQNRHNQPYAEALVQPPPTKATISFSSPASTVQTIQHTLITPQPTQPTHQFIHYTTKPTTAPQITRPIKYTNSQIIPHPENIHDQNPIYEKDVSSPQVQQIRELPQHENYNNQQHVQNPIIYEKETNSNPQTQQPNILYVTSDQSQYQPENYVLIPQSNYEYPQSNQNGVYQNMYLVQIGEQLSLLPPEALYDQNGEQPSAAPLIYQNVNIEQNNNVENSKTNYESSSTHYEPEQLIQGSYGDKINAKLNVNKKSARLIESTKNLVTGQDVLNINDVLNSEVQALVESSTASSIAKQYLSTQKETASSEVNFSTTSSPIPSSTNRVYASPQTTTHSSLLKDPIVVADLDENNLSTYDEEKVFSTTQNTVETVSSLNQFESTEPTVVVTPRPVSTKYLAPITAGVQLQSVEYKESESLAPAKPSVVVEIQKSVPYYLGKFEYIQGANGYEELSETQNKESRNNVELGKTLLQYTIETVPTAQALIQENKSVNILNKETILDQKQESDQHKPQVIVEEINKEQKQFIDYQVQESQNINQHVRNNIQQEVKYVERPYQVSVGHSYPVEVGKVINKPYPVRVPVEVPQHIQIEKKPLNVQPYVFPFEVPKQYPVQVTKLIPQITKTIKVPIPAQVEVNIPHPAHIEVPKYIERPYPVYVNQANNPYSYAPNYQVNCDHKHKFKNNLSYLPVASSFYHTIPLNNYIGLKPPRPTRQQNVHKTPVQPIHHNNHPRKHRNARHSFGQNVRIEYGFMPPLIPSTEIDENGKPIEKHD